MFCSKIRYIAMSLMIFSIISLAGCKSNFNPYKHMHMIMTSTSMEAYENNKEFIDAHTSQDLQSYVHSLFYGVTGAVIEEREVYFEDLGSTVKLLGCYVQTSSLDVTAYWAYFEYEHDILTVLKIYPMSINVPM